MNSIVFFTCHVRSELIFNLLMKRSCMKDDGMFLMAAHINKNRRSCESSLWNFTNELNSFLYMSCTLRINLQPSYEEVLHERWRYVSDGSTYQQKQKQKERYHILKLNLSNEKFCETSDFFYHRNVFPRKVDEVFNDN